MPGRAQRFELFINGIEFCNAYQELNDPREQRARFRAQARDRAAGDAEAQVPDEARQSQIINQNGATAEFERCFAIGSQHLWCRGSQPKHALNPDSVFKKFEPRSFMIALPRLLPRLRVRFACLMCLRLWVAAGLLPRPRVWFAANGWLWLGHRPPRDASFAVNAHT